MDTRNVDTVLIGGKVKKWRGQLVDVDLTRVRQRAEYLISKAGWTRTFLEPDIPGQQ